MSNSFLTRTAAILIVIVLILLYAVCCNKIKDSRKIEEQSKLISSLNDTLKVKVLKDSSQEATIKSFSTQKTKDFLALKVKDSAIIALQDVVKKHEKQLKGGGSVTVISGETNINDAGKTYYVPLTDTVNNLVFPVYVANITNKWYTIKTRADKDTTKVDLKIINSYDVLIGKENGEWFASVTNHNPYTTTRSMRAHNVTMPIIRQKRVNLAIFGGYGFNLKGEVKATPFIGAGISYTLLSLF